VSLHSFDSLFPLRLESLDSSFVSVFDVVQLDLVNTGLGNAARELSPVEVAKTTSEPCEAACEKRTSEDAMLSAKRLFS
jgi:hypothetical protein